MYTHNISLSFDNLDVISTGIKIKQHDAQSHKLIVSGVNFADGDRAIIKFLRPDGVTVCDEFAYNDSEEYIICSAALAESGTISAEISVYNGNARITSHTFTFEVIPDINTDYIFAENDTIPIINSLLNNLENCVKKEIGKGLSTNDYDNDAKAAVDGLAAALAEKADKSVIGNLEDCMFDDKDTVAGKLNTLYGGWIIPLHDEKVSFTDYPKYDKTTDTDMAGVVKVESHAFTNQQVAVDEDGYIKLNPALETEIEDRTSDKIITPTNLDYAVRSVKPKVNTDMMENYGMYYSLNTIHDFGETSGFLITLLGGECGDWVQFDFYTDADAATISIQSYSGGLTDHDFIPEANTAYSLYFDWGIISVTDGTPNYGWRFSYAAYPYMEV